MIPLLIAGAVVGLGAHACASVDNEEAREKNECANKIIVESNRIAEVAKNLCEGSMDALAKEKKSVLQGNMKRFVHCFSQIKPVNFNDTGDIFEIARFNKNELTTIQTMVNCVQKISTNDIVSGVSGTALAVGAADMLTGGSLLGSAGISVGGLAGGAALGAVAAPIFAITGVFSASEASANLEKAKSNLAKANAYQDECKTYSYLAHAVSKRCDLYYKTLNNVNEAWFNDAVNQLEILVNSKKTFGNFLKNIAGKKIYSREEMQMVASVASLAKMIKTIIDTNILDSSGHVTYESEQVILSIQDKVRTQDLSVKIPKSEDSKKEEALGQNYFYKQSEMSVLPKMQVVSQTIKRKNSSTTSIKPNYNPNGFVKFLMWIHTIFWCIVGVSGIVAGSFMAGSILFAAGIMMCPKFNISVRFWGRFGLMILLIIVSSFFM